ncbi:MAG: type II toxin-antitoxin system HicB family antitoxin [Ignavibacteria bacterium]|jgi:predicted RNase H-like HicB family nuclease|nr:type II toxin-antitoxin system HicB family antitoxin [Ignavibacteria bacterium]
MTIQAIVHEEDGQFWAEVPSMPGVITVADTLEEIPFYLNDAIEGWVASMNAHHKLEPNSQFLEIAL